MSRRFPIALALKPEYPTKARRVAIGDDLIDLSLQFTRAVVFGVEELRVIQPDGPAVIVPRRNGLPRLPINDHNRI